MKLPNPRDEDDAKVLKNIAEHGLHIIHVMEEENLPQFTYSMGLGYSFNHPETLIIGLKYELSKWMLNHLTHLLRGGDKKFENGQTSPDFLDGFACNFKSVRPDKIDEYLAWNSWLYNSQSYSALQLIYPNTSGVWPWDDEADDYFKWVQPILSD